jgi:hypothetical protein
MANVWIELMDESTGGDGMGVGGDVREGQVGG